MFSSLAKWSLGGLGVGLGYLVCKHKDYFDWREVEHNEVISNWLKYEVGYAHHKYYRYYLVNREILYNPKNLSWNNEYTELKKEEIKHSILKKPLNSLEYVLDRGIQNIILHPDLKSETENKLRQVIFDEVRGKFTLWQPIYQQTKFYKKKMLITPFTRFIHAPFHPVQGVINRDSPYSRDTNVQENIKQIDNIILWGHSKTDNFIVLEGNHRWYSRGWWPQIITTYVGISKDGKSEWHSTSGCTLCPATNVTQGV